tara:strand:- start:6923 stop:8152 length:1230 start_codon:yes stop_codon:yes gene_type:complete
LKNLKKCRVCNSENFTIVLKLKDTPLEDEFLKRKIYQPTFPLELAICNECFYAFLTYVVSPDLSYKNYMYESSVTVGLNNHYDGYAKAIVENNNISPKSLAIDIGSNDGSMLRSFQKQKLRILGIEPAKEISRHANDKNLYTINDFFSLKLANKIVKEEGKASIITANYMFANIDNLDDFMQGINTLLNVDGCFCIQTGYHPLQFSKNMFDYIYHEHFSYFTLSSLTFLLNKYGLMIVDASITEPKGGSLRVIVKHKDKKYTQSKSLIDLLSKEENNNFNSAKVFYSLENNINEQKVRLITELEKIKKKNFKIAAIGASHSTTTLIYHFEIQRFLDFLIDDNEKKHNTYSPGNHIKVFNKNHLKSQNIKYLVILAWQHQETIINKYRQFLESDVTVIIPLPKFKVMKFI